MAKDTKGFETNARAVWDAYVFCNQLTENNDLLDLVGSYLPHGKEVVYEIQSKLFIAVNEHLHDDPHADPTQTVKVALPQEYQEDLAILYTLAIRLNTLENGTGACFHFSLRQIQQILETLERHRRFSETKNLKSFLQEIIIDCSIPNVNSTGAQNTHNKNLIRIGPEDGPEKADYTCKPEIMESLLWVWISLLFDIYHTAPNTDNFNFSTDEKLNILRHCVFGGQDPRFPEIENLTWCSSSGTYNELGDWNPERWRSLALTNGLITKEERERRALTGGTGSNERSA